MLPVQDLKGVQVLIIDRDGLLPPLYTTVELVFAGNSLHPEARSDLLPLLKNSSLHGTNTLHGTWPQHCLESKTDVAFTQVT